MLYVIGADLVRGVFSTHGHLRSPHDVPSLPSWVCCMKAPDLSIWDTESFCICGRQPHDLGIKKRTRGGRTSGHDDHVVLVDPGQHQAVAHMHCQRRIRLVWEHCHAASATTCKPWLHRIGCCCLNAIFSPHLRTHKECTQGKIDAAFTWQVPLLPDDGGVRGRQRACEGAHRTRSEGNALGSARMQCV